VPLEPFSLNLVQKVFMEIEEPEDPLRFKVRAAAVPERTIGRFYGEIDSRIAGFGESIFTGDPARQVTGVFASFGLIAVDSVETAHTAITTIVEQGEGTKVSPLDPEHELAHYYKFGEIANGARLIPNPDAPPDAPPDERYVYGGDPIPFAGDGVYRLVKNPKVSRYPAGSRAHFACNAFNYTYTSVLKTLHATFNGDPDALPAAIGLMESLKDQAMEIVELELGTGSNAGPTFEYQPVSA
jgi:hypothetical protein